MVWFDLGLTSRYYVKRTLSTVLSALNTSTESNPNKFRWQGSIWISPSVVDKKFEGRCCQTLRNLTMTQNVGQNLSFPAMSLHILICSTVAPYSQSLPHFHTYLQSVSKLSKVA